MLEHTHTQVVGNCSDSEYTAYVARIQAHFDLATRGKPLFRVDIDNMFDVYLNGFHPSRRQYHNCNTCRQFINRFGGLVVMEGHNFKSAIWPDLAFTPTEYHEPILGMIKAMAGAKIEGVFFTPSLELGTAHTMGLSGFVPQYDWHHFAVKLADNHSAHHTRRDLTAGQVSAVKAENFKTVKRALAEWKAEHVEQAVSLLKTGAIPRSEVVLGAAEWLLRLYQERSTTRDRRKLENIMWSFVAQAPDGFCHPRASMLGTLLDDVKAGRDFSAIKRAYADKVRSDKYQRPTAAPTSGSIKQAEELFQKMELAPALRRRFARIEEIQKLWAPTQLIEDKVGIFGGLLAKGQTQAESLHVSTIDITWEKFRRTVLPEAKSMKCLVPQHGGFCAVLTAADETAPRLFQYDNPFSIYLWVNGSPAAQWGLRFGTWADVSGLSLRPEHWGEDGRFKHLPQGAVFYLEKARESRSSGLALFPSLLRSELHGVRSVIEAYSTKGQLEGMAEGTACGLSFGPAGQPIMVRVQNRLNNTITYKIDRWD